MIKLIFLKQSGIKLKNIVKKLIKKLKVKINSIMLKYFFLILISLLFNQTLLAMEKKPYHHLPDGTFRNPEGSPKRDKNINGLIKFLMKNEKKLRLIFLKIMLFQEMRF